MDVWPAPFIGSSASGCTTSPPWSKKSGTTRWNELPLKWSFRPLESTPFSPVHRHRKVLAGLRRLVGLEDDDDAADGRRADGEVEEDARVRVVGQVREELVLPAHGCVVLLRACGGGFW